MKKRTHKLVILLPLALVCFSCASHGASSSFASSSLLEQAGLLVNQGVSEYVIALPSSASAKESFAASELQEMIEKSSGATLPIVKDSAVLSNDLYISIGETGLLKGANLDLTKASTLGTSGYLLKSLNHNLYIVSDPSGDGEGCLYGAYDFLKDAIGYEAYSSDELAYQSLKNIPFYTYDKVFTPSFDTRSIGYMALANNPTYLKRMRLINQYNDERWGLYGHSQCSSLLNVDNQKNNRAWYTGTTLATAQLDYTYGDELETAMANALITYFQKYPKASYFQLGQEDNHNFCTNERSQTAMKEWALNQAGLQINFLNNVITKCEAWLAENDKGREIHYVAYAYYETFDPPVKKDDKGAYVPYSDKVIPNDKLDIFFTPIWTNYGENFSSASNLATKEALEGWSALAKGHLYTYMYDTNFHNYFINFHNILTAKSMYQVYHDNGVNYLYSQGPLDTITPALEEMRIYVESKLMWDLSYSYDDLVKDFMAHYFADAGDDLYQYYDTTMTVLSHYQQSVDNALGSIYSSLGDSEIWTENVVSQLDALLEKGLQDIAYLEDTAPERYLVLKKRIKKEQLTTIYLKLKYYQAYYSASEIEAMKADFKTYTSLFGITRDMENGSIDGMFE
jgi:hypothetical protein